MPIFSDVDDHEDTRDIILLLPCVFTGDGSISLYVETSRTEIGLGCSKAAGERLADNPSSLNLGLDF